MTDARTADEAELVAVFVRRRAEWAFRELYRRHTPRLYQLALRFLAWDDGGAEDACQETWIRAAAKIGEFRWHSRFGTWLVGIGVNVCREQLRHRRSRPRTVPAGTSDEPWAGVYESGDDRRVDLERAIAELPDGYRQVLVLHDVEGLTHPEIGRLLGVEVGTSKSQLSKARGLVRQRLADRDRPGELKELKR